MLQDRPTTEIRVASVPSSHVYVRHLSTDAHPEVVRLPDPVPPGAATAGQWWPPRMLEASWVEANHEDFDLLHVHFGFDACTPDDLRRLVEALRRHGKPLVLTVHDLRNPHHEHRGAHDLALDVLVPAADVVLTLTAGAAAQIYDRWGRTAHVVPHPHVVDEASVQKHWKWSTDIPGEFRVGLHAKSLRACMDPTVLLEPLADVLDDIPGGVLQVDVHNDVADPHGPRHDPELMSTLHGLGDRVDLRVHDYFSDEELFAYLAELDASVLPYRFGTHSGWLEACRDLDTQVVAPTCGFHADQAPVKSFVLDETTFDPASLQRAIWAALVDPAPPAAIDERKRQRAQVAAAHRDLYTEVLTR